MALVDPVTVTAIVLVVVIACVLAIVYAMRKLRKKPEKTPAPSEIETDFRELPFKITKSVKPTEASQAKDELRILELEREILSDAIRRLYEAHAAGKISEQERERLASAYKSRMMAVKEAIAKDETIVALHELESMQEDLMKFFSERFGELSSKVEELRSKINVKAVKEIPVQVPKPEVAEEPAEAAGEEGEEEKEKPKKKKPPEKPSLKSEAEKRIEEIRSEVEKVLDRLGQMEIES